MNRPLILVTNDDGIASAGLWAAVEAAMPLGDVLVVAPDRQWSGAGRGMPPGVTGRIRPGGRVVAGHFAIGYAVDASPALAVVHALTEIAPRRPDLVISGINSGANLSTEVTISGTVGAALEAAAFGLPALAVSLEMEARFHLTGNPNADYEAAIAHTHRWAQRLLEHPMPQGWHVANVNVPALARKDTPWRATRLSLQRYFEPTPPKRANGEGRPGYVMIRHPEHSEPDSDVRAVLVDGVVSVTPLSLDMTASGALQAERWAVPEPAMTGAFSWEAAS